LGYTIDSTSNFNSPKINKEEGPNYKRCALIAVSIWAIVFAIMLLDYELVSNNFIIPDVWISTLNYKCPSTIGKMGYTQSSFVGSGTIACILGAYIGLLIDSSRLGGTSQDINKTTHWVFLARFIICGFVFELCNYVTGKVKYGSNVYVLYFLRASLPAFVLYFLFFSYLKVMLQKMNLVKQ
jgi:hypothetical protein